MCWLQVPGHHRRPAQPCQPGPSRAIPRAPGRRPRVRPAAPAASPRAATRTGPAAQPARRLLDRRDRPGSRRPRPGHPVPSRCGALGRPGHRRGLQDHAPARDHRLVSPPQRQRPGPRRHPGPLPVLGSQRRPRRPEATSRQAARRQDPRRCRIQPFLDQAAPLRGAGPGTSARPQPCGGPAGRAPGPTPSATADQPGIPGHATSATRCRLPRRSIVPLPAVASRSPCGRRCAIGFAEPRPNVHSPGFGAYEKDGQN